VRISASDLKQPTYFGLPDDVFVVGVCELSLRGAGGGLYDRGAGGGDDTCGAGAGLERDGTMAGAE